MWNTNVTKNKGTVITIRKVFTMNDITFSLLIIILLSIIGVLGDSIIKISANSAEEKTVLTLLITGSIIYASTAIGWFYVMRNIKLVHIAIFYPIFTALLLIFIGIFYFGEKLDTRECIGIALAIVSITLISSSLIA